MSAETTLSDARPAARVAHGCDDCGGRIPPGHRYVRQVFVSCGEIRTYKAHDLCHELFLDSGEDGEDWSWECGWEALAEWWQNFVEVVGSAR